MSDKIEKETEIKTDIKKNIENETENKTKNSAGKKDLLNGPVASTLLAFSLPFMLSTLLQTLYSTTDTIVVGQYLGQNGLSAVSNGSQLMQMLYMICIGFSTAGQILIAQASGSGDEGKIQRVVDVLLVMEVVLSVLFGIICVAGSGWMLDVLAIPEEAREQAQYYIVICGAGMIFTGLYNMFSAVLRGVGDSLHPFLFVLIASLANVVLDIVFIVCLDWNVAGAALATVIGQIISVVFSIWYMNRHRESFPFSIRVKNLLLDAETAVKIVKLGIPSAIQSAAIQFSFLFVSYMVNSLGVTVSAAFGVLQKLRNIPAILTQGLNLAANPMIGQNLGAHRTDRVNQTVKSTLWYSTVVNIAFGIVFFAFPVMSFRMFTQDEAVLGYASVCIFSLLVELPARFVMPGCNALVSAQGFVKFSMIVAFVDAFIGRVLFCWLFGVFLGWGAAGFFYGYSLGTYMTAIPVFVYYITGLWKKRTALL
ncbi:MAG: MATE family efflux transporter [Lachnospiraceae bacterium]|nr:MATE family efflux transporter [Lachnospiraceae bacterium]